LGFLAAALGCLSPALVAFFRRVRRVEVHPDRLAWWTGAGPQEASWDKVASVRRLERITNKWWYQTALTLTFTDESQVVFDHTLSGFRDLADRVQAFTAARLVPGKEAELRAGPVTFGPVTLRAEGVAVGDASFRWEGMNYSVSGGHLIVVPAGDNFGWGDRKEVALADIPNVLVLLELMARVGKPPVHPNLVIPMKDREWLKT
jgi:hypothetical protein